MMKVEWTTDRSVMDDYLPKPVSPDRLGTKIGTWLSETVVAKTA